jgi:hypothetical protein
MKQRFSIPLFVAALAPALFAQNSEPGAGSIGSALERWRADHGSGWRVDLDEGTGYAEFVYGAKAVREQAPVSEVEWFLAAREALAAAQDLHGIEPSTLLEERTAFLPLGMIGSSDKLSVRFRQQVKGVPVDGGAVNALFDLQGSLLSIQTRALPHVSSMDVRASITSEAAAFYALAAFDADERLQGELQGEPQLVIAQVEQAEARVGVLSWRIEVQSTVDGEAKGYIYFIDARSGRVAKRENLIHHVDVGGTVYTKATPGNFPDSGTNPAVQQPMRYARVTSSAGTVFTDANGNFNFPGVNGPLNVTTTYVGTYNNVVNQAGASYSLVTSAATGSGNAIVLNNAPTALVTAQANIFQAVNDLRDWIRSVNPADATGDFVYTANANIASTCNAFFNGNSINFYQAGGGCANTAFSNVVMHEAGHWLNVLYGTGNGSDGMGEGNADIYAIYFHDDPIVGHDFCGIGCNVRDANNNRQFCGDANPGCHGGVHANGEVLMGAAWKVRTRIRNSLGTPAAVAITNSLFLDWMLAYNQTQIRSIIETQWLTLDDDDGNIDNGTPHFTDIDLGFRQQGFPGVTLVPLAVGGVTQLANTTDQVGPYSVNASISSNVGATVTSAELLYRVGSVGAFTSVPMAFVSGATYTANIPGQVAPARVHYYVQAGDNLGNTRRFPTNAPTSTLSFAIGEFSVVFCDDFQANLAWSVANTSVSSGAWERGDPIGTTQGSAQAQPETDNPLGTGTLCYFTDQGTAGSTNVGEADLDGGPTVLTSPAINMASGEGEFSYAYWLYNDDGDDSMVVEVSNNGSTWVAARTYTGLGGGWNTDSFAVSSFVTPSATTFIRFRASDNPNNSVTEAAIDDVCATVLGPVSCPAPSTYCTAKVNSLGCTPAIAFSGTPSASNPAPFTVTASQILNNKNSLLFYGSAAAAAPFQGGTLCVQAPLRRTPAQSSGGSGSGNDCTGAPSVDMNVHIQAGTDPILTVGANIFAQYYYRDPADPFTIGLSDAVGFQICP